MSISASGGRLATTRGYETKRKTANKQGNMKEETRQLLDIIIDKMNLERSTGMCREEIRKNIDKAATLLDLSVCLADVVDSMMMDVADIAAKVKIPMMDDRERSYFKELKKLVNATRKWANRITRDYRHSERDGDLAIESDWWYHMILMVEDRIGTDNLKTKQLIQWISTMPSQLNLFDNIHTKDFEVMK
jgi:hypothetical protein